MIIRLAIFFTVVTSSSFVLTALDAALGTTGQGLAWVIHLGINRVIGAATLFFLLWLLYGYKDGK